MNEQAAQLAAARRDWQLYHTLSEELLKFISQEDIDEFLLLTQQRTALVERMKMGFTFLKMTSESSSLRTSRMRLSRRSATSSTCGK